MSVVQAEYSNKLEQFYNGAPGAVKTVMNFFGAFDMIRDLLYKVTGDPNKVAGKGADYIQAGQDIQAVAEAVSAARSGITQWSGAARSEFDAKIVEHVEKIGDLAQAVTKTDEILKAAAKACVEGANLVIDIVVTVVKWCIRSFLAALATSWCSFGATVGAWIGANVARGIQAFQKIMSALQKLGSFLQKLATMLQKLSQILAKVKTILQAIQQVLSAVGESDSGFGKLVGKGISAIDKVTAVSDAVTKATSTGSTSSTPAASGSSAPAAATPKLTSFTPGVAGTVR